MSIRLSLLSACSAYVTNYLAYAQCKLKITIFWISANDAEHKFKVSKLTLSI
jgi:hypothetical protein